MLERDMLSRSEVIKIVDVIGIRITAQVSARYTTHSINK